MNPIVKLPAMTMMYSKRLEEYHDIFKDILVEPSQLSLGGSIGEGSCIVMHIYIPCLFEKAHNRKSFSDTYTGAFGTVQKGVLSGSDGQLNVALKSPKGAGTAIHTNTHII